MWGSKRGSWKEDNRVDRSSERTRTPRKNVECVGVCVCVCLYLCVSEKGEREPLLEAPHKTVREKALLIACWCEGRDLKKWKKINSVETALFGPQGSPSTTETPARGSAKDTCLSLKVCVHRLLQALQHEHCNGNTCPPGGAVSLGTKWGFASLIWFQLYLQNQQ